MIKLLPIPSSHIPSVRRTLLLAALAAGLFAVPSFAAPISVHVVDDAGKPVAGAKVLYHTRKLFGQTGETDGDGRLNVDIPDADKESRWVIATVMAPGKGLTSGMGLWKEALAGFAPIEVKAEKAVSLSGVVRDKWGKPAAGVHVRLRGINEYARMRPNSLYISPGKGPEWAQFTTVSDAEGRWTLNALPPNNSISFEIDDDTLLPDMATIAVGSQDAQVARPLVAQPGGSLSGRVTDNNGKPIPKVQVQADYQGGKLYGIRTVQSAETDADGRYRITRLASGTYAPKVTLFDLFNKREELPFAPSATSAVQVQEGQETKGADIQLTPGAIVEGTVTDAETGAPVKDVLVGVPGNIGRTGEDGKFRIHATPSESLVYISGTPEGYLNLMGRSSVRVNLKEGHTKTVLFTLRPAASLTGKAVDEKGKPLAEVPIVAGSGYSAQTVTTGEDGTFKVGRLTPGEIELFGSGDWALVAPLRVTVPAKEAVVMRLKKVTVPSLSGRVIDEAGRPVTGATVTLKQKLDTGEVIQWQAPTVATDDKGTWTYKPPRDGLKYVVSAEKFGYRPLPGGAELPPAQVLTVRGDLIDAPGGGRRIEDIVLQGLLSSAAGRVLDERGEPLANAYVWAPDTGLRTDAEGRWVLRDLPSGPLTVYATDGINFAVIKTVAKPTQQADAIAADATAVDAASPANAPAPAEGVDIRLAPIAPPPTDSNAQLAFFRDSLDTRDEYRLQTSLERLALTHPEEALELADRAVPASRNKMLLSVLRTYARYRPDEARARMKDLLGSVNLEWSGQVAVELAISIAPYLPNPARTAYDSERMKLKAVDISTEESISVRLNIAALAARLGLPDEAKLIAGPVLDALLDKYQNHDKTDKTRKPWEEAPDNQLLRRAAIVGAGGAELTRWAAAKLPQEMQQLMLAHALPAVVRSNTEEGRALLAEVRQLPDIESEFNEYTTKAGIHGAITLLILRDGPRDPQGALALARTVEHRRYRAKILALAATYLPEEERRKVLEEAFALPGEYAQATSRNVIVRRALAVEPALGRKLAEQLEAQTMDENLEYRSDDNYSAFKVANAVAGVRPGDARMLLEKLWYRPQQEQGITWSNGQLVASMMTVDWNRALEMGTELLVRDRDQLALVQTRSMMGKWLVTPPEFRPNLQISGLWWTGNEPFDTGY